MIKLSSICRKIRQIPKFERVELYAYMRSPLNKLLDKFHRKQIHLFKANEVSKEVLYEHCGFDCSSGTVTADQFKNLVSNARTYIDLPSTADITLCKLLYEMIILIKPDKVLESGVWRGVSSYFCLSALNQIGKGELYSVDFQPMDPHVRVTVGEAVPESLRKNWHLNIGPASALMPKVCSEMKQIDLFLHDSEHTYVNMMMEFETVWPHLRPGGIIVADDADWNDSVVDFSEKEGIPFYCLNRKKGGYISIIIKPRSD